MVLPALTKSPSPLCCSSYRPRDIKLETMNPKQYFSGKEAANGRIRQIVINLLVHVTDVSSDDRVARASANGAAGPASIPNRVKPIIAILFELSWGIF